MIFNRLLAATIVFAAVSSTAADAQQARAESWGAIAVDKVLGAHGEANDFPSRKEAEAAAIERAKSAGGYVSTKLIVSWSGKGCGSYVAEVIPMAVGPNMFGPDGWGIGPDLFAAQNAADRDMTAPRNEHFRRRVEVCNSAGSEAVKVGYSAPKPSPDDCLLQYELQLDDANGDWKTRIYSEVYRLKKADCPLVGDSEYSSYLSLESGGKREHRSNALPSEDEAMLARGYLLTDQFLDEVMRHTAWAGLHFRPAASMTAVRADEEILAALRKHTGGHDAGDRAGLGDGICINWAPDDVESVEQYGFERCKKLSF